MKTRSIGILILTLGLLIVGGLWLVSRMSTSVYPATGTIVGFSSDTTRVFIAHGPVPGLMPEMTMPFTVEDKTALENLAPKDSVSFSILVEDGVTRAADFVIVRKGVGLSFATRIPDPPSPGDRTPRVVLTDMEGRTIDTRDLPTDLVLLTFIYTRCPLPDYCPLMSLKFSSLQAPVADQFGGRVGLLSISFDPEYDTPDVLREYATRYTRDTSTWRFAVGTENDTALLTSFFGVRYELDGVYFDHNLTTALVDSAGVVQAIWPGNDWQNEDVIAAIEQNVANEMRPPAQN